MYSRFFAFGCSFTSYYWPTWADIIGQEFSDRFYNLAMCGAGNEFMFHKLTEAHARYNITKDDLVIICWTNFSREDRYMQGKWKTAGNMSTQVVYPQEWVRKWFDFRGALLKTSSVIAGATHLLDTTGCEYMFTSMIPMNRLDQYDVIFADESYHDIFDVYNSYYNKIHPVSMTEHLYGINEYKNPKSIQMKLKDDQHHGMTDHHPSPNQHLNYATNIILPNLQKTVTLNTDTIVWANNWDDHIYAKQPYRMLDDGWTPEFRYNKWHKNMC